MHKLEPWIACQTHGWECLHPLIVCMVANQAYKVLISQFAVRVLQGVWSVISNLRGWSRSRHFMCLGSWSALMNKAAGAQIRTLQSLLVGTLVSTSPVVTWPFSLLPASSGIRFLWRVLNGVTWRCSSKNVRVGFLQLRKHLWTVLSLLETAWQQLYWLKDLIPENVVSNNEDRFLEHIVSELVGSQSLDNQIHA